MELQDSWIVAITQPISSKKKNGINWNEEVKLTSSDASPHDGFGMKVAIFNDFAIVSSPGDDDNGSNSGSAYIFERNGTNWIEQVKLTGNDAPPNDFFGESVSISDNYAVVGASNNGVYVFKKMVVIGIFKRSSQQVVDFLKTVLDFQYHWTGIHSL